MANLYDLMREYQELQELFYDPDASSEDVDAALNKIDEAKGSVAEKIDNIGCLLRNIDADITALDREKKRLEQRKKSLEGRKERVRDWVRDTMKILDVPKIRTDKFTVSLSAPKKTVKVLNEKLLPDEYVRVERVPDKKALLKAYTDDGEIVEGCDIVDGKPSVTFR